MHIAWEINAGSTQGLRPPYEDDGIKAACVETHGTCLCDPGEMTALLPGHLPVCHRGLTPAVLALNGDAHTLGCLGPSPNLCYSTES